MSLTSRLEKYIKIVVWVVAFGCLWAALFLNAYQDRQRSRAVIDFMEAQNRFNNKVVLTIEKLIRTAQYNFDFNKSNKLLIKRIIETEIPDETALLGEFSLKESSK